MIFIDKIPDPKATASTCPVDALSPPLGGGREGLLREGLRSIERVLAPPPVQWTGNGSRAHNFFPHLPAAGRMSPFCRLSYHARMFFSVADTPRETGIHPHRGIETVTAVYHGRVVHRDSTGYGGVTGEGDVRWTTAGSGILHREYYEAASTRRGSDFQMAEVWVSLPPKNKMTTPRYRDVRHGQIPKYPLPGKAGTVEVIAGSRKGRKGLVPTFSPMEVYHVRLVQGGSTVLSLPQSHNTGILVVKGLVKVNHAAVALTDQFILFGNTGEDIYLQAVDDSVLLVLSGEPVESELRIES